MDFYCLDYDYIEAMALDLLASSVVSDYEKAKEILAEFWKDKITVVLDSAMVQGLVDNPDFYLSNEDALSVLKNVLEYFEIHEITPEIVYHHIEAMLRDGAIELIQCCEGGNYWEEKTGGRLLIRKGNFILVRYGATEFTVYESPDYAWELRAEGDWKGTFQSIGSAIQNLVERCSQQEKGEDFE